MYRSPRYPYYCPSIATKIVEPVDTSVDLLGRPNTGKTCFIMANKALLPLALPVLYLITVRVEAEPCGGHLGGSAIAAILAEKHPRCRDVDLSLSPLVCELSNEDISRTKYGAKYIPARSTACPDGTVDKVCYPDELNSRATLMYNCVCRSFIDKSIGVSAGYWTDWVPLNHPVNGMHYSRSFLLDDNTCIIQEFSQVEIQYPSTAVEEVFTWTYPVTEADAAAGSGDISDD